MQCSKGRRYSITSSATASSDGGTLIPSIRAMWALMTSSCGHSGSRAMCQCGLMQRSKQHRSDAQISSTDSGESSSFMVGTWSYTMQRKELLRSSNAPAPF
jgi:hypothetical protein